MRVLFSPIGGTDPISNFKDGAMLHICRHYMPDKVYLYLSKEMCEFHDMDNRYLYCLDKLGDMVSHEFEVELIRRDDVEDVQIFDSFMEEYRGICAGIMKAYPDAEIYVNVSSGTPAMKSVLLMLSILSEGKIIPIQVATPVRKINPHAEDRKNYDCCTYWELNEDNESGAENRCAVASSRNWILELRKEVAIRHVEAYDYVAALRELDKENHILSSEVINLLKAADARLKLDFSEMQLCMNKLPQGSDFIPVKDMAVKPLVEYTLGLAIKQKREEYSDFIRAISPILLDLYDMILQQECGINITKNYGIKKFDSRTNVSRYVWDLDKVNGNADLKKIFSNAYPGGLRAGDITNDNLRKLITTLCENADTVEKVESIEAVERWVRNPAAHEIVSITDEAIQKKAGITSGKIIATIKILVDRYVIKGRYKNVWNSYDAMNQTIIDAIRNMTV